MPLLTTPPPWPSTRRFTLSCPYVSFTSYTPCNTVRPSRPSSSSSNSCLDSQAGRLQPPPMTCRLFVPTPAQLIIPTFIINNNPTTSSAPCHSTTTTTTQTYAAIVIHRHDIIISAHHRRSGSTRRSLSSEIISRCASLCSCTFLNTSQTLARAKKSNPHSLVFFFL